MTAQPPTTDLFARDAATPLDFSSAPADESLRTIANAARSLATLEAQIEQAETALAVMTTERTRLSMQVLPELLDAMGTDQVGLSDLGCDVVVEDFYRASVKVGDTPEFREAAFAHLVELGGGDLIRATLTVSFDKEDYEVARSLHTLIRKYLEEMRRPGTPSSLDLSVHHGLLTSFVRDWFEARRGDPDDEREGSNTPVLDPRTLGATVGRIARVVRRDGSKRKRRKSR